MDCEHLRVEVRRTENMAGSYDPKTQDVTLDEGRMTDWTITCNGCGEELEAGITNYDEPDLDEVMELTRCRDCGQYGHFECK